MVRDSSPTPSHLSKVGHGKSKEALSKDDKATPPKLALLDTFNGSCAKLKAHLAQIDLYISFNMDKFKAEMDKVMWAISFLQGLAFD
jgi:hypothetical protein